MSAYPPPVSANTPTIITANAPPYEPAAAHAMPATVSSTVGTRTTTT